MLWHFLWLLFDIPSGSIWSNLVASPIWAAIVGIIMWLLHKKQSNNIDSKLQEHHENIKETLNEVSGRRKIDSGMQ